MLNIVILSSSTRIQRLSHRVALHLSQRLSDHQTEVLDLAAYDFPIMEEVIDKLPQASDDLKAFSQKIMNADACIFVSPEYNGSYTAALKNAVDYLSENNFDKKVVGVCSVSNGALGGMRGAMLMQQLVLGVGGYPIPQMLLAGLVEQRFDEAGNLTDPTFDRKINQFLQNFLWLAEAVKARKAQ